VLLYRVLRCPQLDLGRRASYHVLAAFAVFLRPPDPSELPDFASPAWEGSADRLSPAV